MNYPKKPSPVPPLSAKQLFIHHLRQTKGEDYVIHFNFKEEWEGLFEFERKKYEDDANENLQKFKEELKAWEEEGGLDWDKKIRVGTEKGILKIKAVGNYMRTIDTRLNVNAAATRMMATATELFVGAMARDILLQKDLLDKITDNSENEFILDEQKTREIRLIDVHEKIHSDDCRFNFLTDDFAPPSTLVDHVDTSDPHFDEEEEFNPEKKPTAAPVKKKEYKPHRMIHRPKLEYVTVQKLHAALNPKGPTWENEKDKQKYQTEFSKLKSDHDLAYEKWKRDYPEEFQALLKKREDDRERSKKKKMKMISETQANSDLATNSDTLAAIAGLEAVGTIQNQIMNIPTEFRYDQTTLPQNYYQPAYDVFRQQNQATQISNSDQHQKAVLQMQQKVLQQQQLKQQQQVMQKQQVMHKQQVMQKQQQIYREPTRKVIEDPTLPPPWKQVHLLNIYGQVEDIYFWNTTTDSTSWDRPSPF